MEKKYHKRNRFFYLLKYLMNNPSLIGTILHKNKIKNFLINIYEQKTKKVILKSRPYLLQIEPICGCNLNCPLCPIGNSIMKRKRGLMKYEDYLKIMEKLEDNLISISFWNWGEPLLNKDIFKMISYAKEKKIHTIMNTNGYYISRDSSKRLIESGLDEIKISIDGASKETYAIYRKNSDFDGVLGNIGFLIKEKNAKRKKFRVTMQFIVMKHNQHEIERIKKLAKEIGVDFLSMKTVSAMMNQQKIEGFLPDKDEFSRYYSTDYKIRPKEFKFCSLPWKIIVVNWDGTVTACCMDYDARYKLGNMLCEEIVDVWNGNDYVKFRQAMLKNGEGIKMCKDCDTSQERFIE